MSRTEPKHVEYCLRFNLFVQVMLRRLIFYLQSHFFHRFEFSELEKIPIGNLRVFRGHIFHFFASSVFDFQLIQFCGVFFGQISVGLSGRRCGNDIGEVNTATEFVMVKHVI